MTGIPCYNLGNMMAMLAIGLFIGGLIGAGVVNYVRSTRSARELDVIRQNTLDIFSKLNVMPGIEAVVKGNQALYKRSLELMDERNQLLRAQNTGETEDNKDDDNEVAILKMDRSLAITTLRNVISIDLGNDSSNVQTIRFLATEALKNIGEDEKSA